MYKLLDWKKSTERFFSWPIFRSIGPRDSKGQSILLMNDENTVCDDRKTQTPPKARAVRVRISSIVRHFDTRCVDVSLLWNVSAVHTQHVPRSRRIQKFYASTNPYIYINGQKRSLCEHQKKKQRIFEATTNLAGRSHPSLMSPEALDLVWRRHCMHSLKLHKTYRYPVHFRFPTRS